MDPGNREEAGLSESKFVFGLPTNSSSFIRYSVGYRVGEPEPAYDFSVFPGPEPLKAIRLRRK